LQHIRWNVATKLGVLTYPLYLVHEYWGLYLISKLRDAGPTYVILAVVAVAMIGFAWVLNRFVERPFASRVRRSVDHALRERGTAGSVETVPTAKVPDPVPAGSVSAAT
jgi:peptidoglycan/LPS O-acetylase OafA/YrhL